MVPRSRHNRLLQVNCLQPIASNVRDKARNALAVAAFANTPSACLARWRLTSSEQTSRSQGRTPAVWHYSGYIGYFGPP